MIATCRCRRRLRSELICKQLCGEKLFDEVYQKHENPWQFENWGSIRARRYSDKIYHLRKDAKRVFIYPDGGIIADERWHTEAAVELLKRRV